ncbi:MAG: radical SAM/SPASM domain-containing protein [Myxococcota bacterium]|jgi:pyruvate-formate lyase-activating enzyme|nr:radical SAM/SPASM domain-containing protein [Myxococcota bacterium]
MRRASPAADPATPSRSLPLLAGETKLLALLAARKIDLDDPTSPPWTLEIDPTQRCNLSCGFCPWRARLPDAALPPEILLATVAGAASLGVRGLIFTGGGEPLLHPALPAAVDQAVACGMSVGLYTNGTLVTRELAQRLIPGLAWVRLNLPAADPRRYQELTGRDLWAAAWQGAAELLRARGAASRPRVGLGLVVSGHRGEQPDDLGRELTSLARQASRLGLDFLQLKHDLTRLADPAYGRWWDEQVPRVADRVRQQVPGLPLLVAAGGYRGQAAPAPCRVALLAPAVRADGQVVACRWLRDREDALLGDLHQVTLPALWHGEAVAAMRQRLARDGCAASCAYQRFNRQLAQGRRALDEGTGDGDFL